MNTKVITNTKIKIIAGPAGDLELAVDISENTDRTAWGIVCHPHPLYGGSMQNKVVTTLSKTFVGMGVNTVRFNFRGVGKSVGQYAEGDGELEDLMAVIDWVQNESGQKELWLGGFSFGSFIAYKAACLVQTKKLVLIAPPVQNFPFEMQTPLTEQWIVVQGEKDDVVNPSMVFAWVEGCNPQPTVLRFKEAGHYFHGLLVELRERLQATLSEK